MIEVEIVPMMGELNVQKVQAHKRKITIKKTTFDVYVYRDAGTRGHCTVADARTGITMYRTRWGEDTIATALLRTEAIIKNYGVRYTKKLIRENKSVEQIKAEIIYLEKRSAQGMKD